MADIICLYICEAWWRIGRVDALRPEDRGFEARSSRHVVLHLQLPVVLQRVNFNTLSIAVVGIASERFIRCESAIEMGNYNSIQYIIDTRSFWDASVTRLFKTSNFPVAPVYLKLKSSNFPLFRGS